MPSSADSFVQLHTHTEVSMLDGAARLVDLFKEASRMELPALAPHPEKKQDRSDRRKAEPGDGVAQVIVRKFDDRTAALRQGRSRSGRQVEGHHLVGSANDTLVRDRAGQERTGVERAALAQCMETA